MYINDVFDNVVVDSLGGMHCNGMGVNPHGILCGECSSITCEGCVNSKIKMYSIKDKAVIHNVEGLRSVKVDAATLNEVSNIIVGIDMGRESGDETVHYMGRKEEEHD